MTTGAVGKDVGAVLMNLQANRGSKNAADGVGFQQVWNSQMNSGAAGENAANAPEKQSKPGKQDIGKNSQSGKIQDARQTEESYGNDRVGNVQESSEPVAEEIQPEDLEEAMEVLGTAAADLMQQIAEVFGISMEELQAAMDELGLEAVDVLDASKLGALLLQLGGAEDSYALITDETLYSNYQMLMQSMRSTLQSCADELDFSQEQMMQILEEDAQKHVLPEELVPAVEEVVPEDVTDMDEDQEPLPRISVDEGIAGPGESVDGAEEEILRDGKNTQNQNNRQPGSDRHKEQAAGRAHQENVYVQEFRTNQYTANAAEVENVRFGSAWDTDTQDIMNQIMDHMKLQLNADTKSLEMQLHPESLGTLHVQIASKGGVVTANFITQNETVKAALESQMVQLRETFEEQGVKIEAIEVTVQTHEFERNLEQGRGRQQQDPQRRNRARRTNLNDPVTMEELEEEEELAAKVRAANGSTVEYTA